MQGPSGSLEHWALWTPVIAAQYLATNGPNISSALLTVKHALVRVSVHVELVTFSKGLYGSTVAVNHGPGIPVARGRW